MMTEISQYLPGIIAAYTLLLLGCFSPGPAVALLIGIATAEGRSPALLATPGIAAGSMTINLVTISGVGLVLSHAVWAVVLSLVAVREAYLKGRRWIELTLGCFFVIFACKLITTES